MERRWLCILILLLGLAAPLRAEISGVARVLDGDTLEIGALTVRLHGMDAPETGQRCGGSGGSDWPCGVASAERLASLIAGGMVTCAARDRDAYGRVVAVCRAQGGDLGGQLVREGLAWAYWRYSADYGAAEAAARAAGRGVWQGLAVAAWDWRLDRVQMSSRVPSTGPEGCTIKGNVNAKGERIYHTIASPWYARVRIDPNSGQRWFCSQAEAEAAGWRPVAGRR